MTQPKYPKQAEEIQAVLTATKMGIEELAKKLAMKKETIRKYANGYQRASQRLMGQIKEVGSGVVVAPHSGKTTEDSPEWNSPRAKLRYAVKAAGLTVQKLAKQIGYDAGVIDAVVNGGARASEAMIDAICREVDGLSKDELMGGSEVPLILGVDGLVGTHGSKSNIQLPPGTKGRFVPLLSLAQAGAFDAYHDDGAYSGEGVFAFNVIGSRSFAIRVSGTSMEPEIMEGDVVVCSPDEQLHNGDSAVIRTHSGQAFIKFWNRRGDSAVLESANPSFSPLTFPASEIAGAWAIVQKISSGKIKRA